jgi:hypothetical protein
MTRIKSEKTTTSTELSLSYPWFWQVVRYKYYIQLPTEWRTQNDQRINNKKKKNVSTKVPGSFRISFLLMPSIVRPCKAWRCLWVTTAWERGWEERERERVEQSVDSSVYVGGRCAECRCGAKKNKNNNSYWAVDSVDRMIDFTTAIEVIKGVIYALTAVVIILSYSQVDWKYSVENYWNKKNLSNTEVISWWYFLLCYAMLCYAVRLNIKNREKRVIRPRHH